MLRQHAELEAAAARLSIDTDFAEKLEALDKHERDRLLGRRIQDDENAYHGGNPMDVDHAVAQGYARREEEHQAAIEGRANELLRQVLGTPAQTPLIGPAGLAGHIS